MTDQDRAEEIRSDTHVPNEIHQYCTLLSMQIVLLQDIRDLLSTSRTCLEILVRDRLS